MHQFPMLSDKSIYLACTLSSTAETKSPTRFALVSVPARRLPRFVLLPSPSGEKHIILLEDIIRYCLPNIFSFFDYDQISSHLIKVTRDAELDMDNDISTTLTEKIQRGLSNRKKGKPVRLVYDKEIPAALLDYLIRRLGLTNKDSLIPGGRIHNFKDFMHFPEQLLPEKNIRKKPFTHPAFNNVHSVATVILQQDTMLHLPYHSFNTIVDLIRESAIDPEVTSIKITCYRLAPRSKIINALTNAVRNGKQVTVVIELRARFDEEANLEWKKELEEAGVKVLTGIPGMKTHAKICRIERRTGKKTISYGFVSTGNLNEKTGTIYGDHCLLTANKSIMKEVQQIFSYLEQPTKKIDVIKSFTELMVSPFNTRKQMLRLIQFEINQAKKGKTAFIYLKLNSLSDQLLILKLMEAARNGVELKLIIRGICCLPAGLKNIRKKTTAVSIVDEYLEHGRVMIFHHGGKEKTYISSADWMLRNLDHRVEATCEIHHEQIKKELKSILDIQLSDNVKARILDNEMKNEYVKRGKTKRVRSQVEIYRYLSTLE
jgi:polyphosphate kinase